MATRPREGLAIDPDRRYRSAGADAAIVSNLERGLVARPSGRPIFVTAMNHPEFPDKSMTADAEWRSVIDVE